MEWRKLKNIILIILIGLNLSLIMLVGGPRLLSLHRQNQALEEAVEFLGDRGILVEDQVIPGEDRPQAMLVQRDLAAEERCAQRLLGEAAQKSGVGGDVYRYEGPGGAAQFHSDGVFWVRLEPGAIASEENPEIAVYTAMDRLGMDYRVLERDQNGLTALQLWENRPVFNQEIEITWSREGLEEITGGRRIYGPPIPDPTREPLPRASALIHFFHALNERGDVCSRIHGIEEGYVISASLNRLMSLTPVWHITTDTGVYQMDLVNGSLTRVLRE